jgi:hypothetical protein
MKKNTMNTTYWQFFNSGTGYKFDPEKLVQTINGERMKNGELHKNIVKEWNSPDVYLLNEHGEIIDVD